MKTQNGNSFLELIQNSPLASLSGNGLEDYKPKFIKKANVAFPYGNWSHHFT